MKLIILLIALVLNSSVFAQNTPTGPHIPVDKNLDAKWVKSLFEKGERKVYKGEELTHIAMPCGGIGAGQVEVTGQGEICFTESVYNLMQQPNAGHGLSTGYQYLHPQKSVSKVENSFVIELSQKGKKTTNLSFERNQF